MVPFLNMLAILLALLLLQILQQQ